MDVTSAIRINELSQELLKKGMAESSEDASAMAEKFLQRDIAHAGKPVSDDSEEDKKDILIERMQRQVNNAFTAMEGRMKSMAGQIEILRNELNLFKKAGVPEKVEIREEQPVVEEVQSEEPQKKLAPKAEPEADRNQRIGKLKPGDISIESFFYCGEKNDR